MFKKLGKFTGKLMRSLDEIQEVFMAGYKEGYQDEFERSVEHTAEQDEHQQVEHLPG